MPLLFLLLVVTLFGAVAIVAAGRGGSLTPRAGASAHDRAPSGLPPPDQPLTAADVGALRFALAFRGYRVDEVDEAFDRLATELAAHEARIRQLEGRAAADRSSAGPATQDPDAPERR